MSLFFPARRPDEQRVMTMPHLSTWSNVTVGPATLERTLRLGAVFGAVRLLADAVASLPIHVYRMRPDGVRELITTPTLFDAPCSYGTRFDWVHRLMVSLLLRGNAYGLITGWRNGWPTGVEWLHPDRVHVDETGPMPVYYVDGRRIDSMQLVHAVLFATPGTCVGLSVVSTFAQTVNMGLYASDGAADWFKNPVPQHSLKNEAQTISPDAADEVKARFKASTKSGDVFVHGRDWTLSTIGVSAADARFLEAIKANATVVAAIFGVPPERIGGEAGTSMTYQNGEQQGIDLLQNTVRPHVVRLEELFNTLTARPQFVKLNTDAMIRTDLKSRYEAHGVAIDKGFLTVDEVRALEDRAPLPQAPTTGGSA